MGREGSEPYGTLVWTAKGATLNRLTQSYVVVAISGTATIVAAVVAFVMLVSLQTIQEWPVSGLGSGAGDSGGVTRATDVSAPARAAAGRSSAATPSGLSGTGRAPAGAAAPGARAERHGRLDLGSGSAIGGRGNRSSDEPTSGPIASTPGVASDPPSDAGSAAPVEPTRAGNGSGASAGSRSVSGVGNAPPEEAADTPTGQGHGSAAGEGSGNEHAAKAPGSTNPASTKSKKTSEPSSPTSKSKATRPPAAPGNTASGHGPPEPPGSHAQGTPGGPK